ncbi:SnoaL-like polyketide cyclase [Yinghuangia seranimata]|uniref:SnoaL-like polyketide cyclase n=1 Tax=Yinghuangia seranimata TaxID=408067 RepID=UPI00248B156C|nr:SnoaL-like polyketide cyclase [Yinghuangia seranimata]MDI2132013.1 SnoaL-like polyketide cyclase [Yinghuangia seranimata]
MTTSESTEAPETPLWLQGREAVVAAAAPEDWRDEAPDYHLSHTLMPKQRTHTFDAGSLEAIVESLVQVFEMEVSHKKDPATWVSMVTEKFRTNVNGGPWATAADIAEIGSYNILIGDSVFYRTGQESFESSHDVFHKALPNGFFWEVLEVLTPPPVVTFKWRHWGKFEGEYNGFAPTGETVEMFGVSIAKVSDDLRLLDVEHYYDPNTFLGKLTGGCPVAHTAG